MRAWALAMMALLAPAHVAAQDVSGWQRDDTRSAGIADKPAAEKVEYLLEKWRLDALPTAPTEAVFEIGYRWTGNGMPYEPFYTQASSRESPVFRPDDRFPGDCTALIAQEKAQILTGDVRSALGIVFQPVEAAGGYAVPMYDFPQGGAMFAAYVLDGGPLWREEERDGRRYFIRPLDDGETIDSPYFPLDNGSPTTIRWLRSFLPHVEYRTEGGVCRLYEGRITIFIPITLAAPGAKAAPATVAAPKAVAPKTPAPKGGGPVLTRTGPPPPKPEAPKAIVYKPGERPTPPVAPKLPPCPKDMACAVAEGAPPTPEGLAYMEQMRAYEVALKAFEADEAAKRQAVADLNKQKQAEYSANLAAIEKERTDALTARDAKIAADKASYNAALKAHQDESSRLAREHEAAMAEWRRKTAACLAGDMSQCANSGDK
jgi:hypothetical protein